MKDKKKAAMPKKKNIIAALLPYFRRKRIWIGCLVLLVLLGSGILAACLPRGGNGILPYAQNIEVISYNGKLHVLVDEALIGQPEGALECSQLRTSLDGKIGAFLTDTKELFVVDGQRLKKVANDVHHFEISASGLGVAYAQKYADQYALTLYNVPERTSREVTDALSKLDFSLSPDGETLAYFVCADSMDILMCYRKGKSSVIAEEKTDLVGLSNDGKNIYGVCALGENQSELYSFNIRGKKQKLGPISSISIKFNDDHRQIMFYHEGKTYISVNGQEGIQSSSNPLYMVTAPNSQSASDGNSITYPVESLFNRVYTCSDGESTGAWLIRKNPEKNIKLVSRVSGCTLDASAKYLYYIHDSEQLRVIRIKDGEDASKQYRSLADGVDAYVVTNDRNKVFFTKEGTLCSVNAKKGGKVRTISESFTGYNLVVNKAGIIYYQENDQLYLCKNGKKGIHTEQTVQSLYSSSNSVVYILGSEGISTSHSSKQPKPVKASE